jgi:hypothetical protein
MTAPPSHPLLRSVRQWCRSVESGTKLSKLERVGVTWAGRLSWR